MQEAKQRREQQWRSGHAWLSKIGWLTAALLLTLALLLAACSGRATMLPSQVRLDAGLQHARFLGVPERDLAPIIAQEQQVDHSGGFFANLTGSANTARARTYQLLDAQLQGVIARAAPDVKATAARALYQFSYAFQALGAGFPQVSMYQRQLVQLQEQYKTARTLDDYAQVQHTAASGLTAIATLRSTHAALQSLRQQQAQLAVAGMAMTPLLQQYQADTAQFRAAQTTTAYRALAAQVAAQQQATARAALQQLPHLAQGNLARLQQLIVMAGNAGIATDADARIVRTAQQQLTTATALAGYLPVAQRLYQQVNALQRQFNQKEAQTALNQLQALVTYGEQRQWLVYEYAAALSGLQSDLAHAATPTQYQAITDNAYIQLINLRAMLANYRDKTPSSRPHTTDLQVMQAYGLSGKVIVISLGEQAARLYDDGKLVYWSYVTTGRRSEPTPSGLWHVYQKNSPIYYTSPDPPGSPLYFQPTLVHYSMAFHPGGYFLHDAWWRHEFGPGTNLPHYDPAAFNGGSHGCINFPTPAARWIYAWAPLGTPVVVY
jgi:lipoprotein-anchoring transpeptidase ErfK/SrfK